MIIKLIEQKTNNELPHLKIGFYITSTNQFIWAFKLPQKNYFYKSAAMLFLAYAVFMVSLSAIGGIKSFTSVPYWDMWGPYLDFYMEPTNGFSSWWTQHNEHRIILAKALFWLDVRYFSGLSYFLILANYFFVVLEIWIFFKIFDKKSIGVDPNFQFLLKCYIVAWLFSWSQYDNLTWAFQSQFFLAQLLPLCGFYWFSKSINSPTKVSYFLGAILFGVLSLGSMANGIFAMPLLFVYSIIASQGWRRSSALFILSAITIAAYLYGYHTPAGHASPLNSLLSSPYDYLRYVLYYLGVPFYFIFEGVRIAGAAAIIGGIFLLASYLIFAIKLFVRREYGSMNFAIIIFGVFILATAVVTGGGRLIFGANQALTSRYCTPALMMWAGLFIMLSPALSRLYVKRKSIFLSVVAIASIGLIPMQLRAINIDGDINFNREVAALALTLGVRDLEQISKIYPAPDVAIAISEKAKKNNLSIFGADPYKGLGDSINMNAVTVGHLKCIGNLDEVIVLNGATYSRIRGWIYSPDVRLHSKMVQIINETGSVVGYALVGQRRDDVMHHFGASALKSGFIGYVKATAANSSLGINSSAMGCEVTLRLENKP